MAILAGLTAQSLPAQTDLPPVEGTYVDIDIPGCGSDSPNDINNHGVIVGSCGLSGPSFIRYPDGTSKLIEFPGADSTYVLAINEAGTIVGSYWVGDISHGFLQTSDGDTTFFDVPGAIRTYPRSLNNAGTVCGSYETPEYHGFVRLADGQLFTFDIPGAVFIAPESVNDAGVVVGWWQDSQFQYHSFYWTQSSGVVMVNLPGMQSSQFLGINRWGMILGYDDDEPQGAFLLWRGNIKTFPSLTVLDPSLNNRGIIVGSLFDAPFFFIGALALPNGVMGTIIPPDAINTFPVAINDQNVVVGWYERSGRSPGFMFTPTTPGWQ